MIKGSNTRDYNRSNISYHARITKAYDRLIKDLGITYATLRDLIIVYDYYNCYGKGISPAELNKAFSNSHGTYPNMFDRLNSLQSKELVIGCNRSYVPTPKAIQLLNSIKV